MIIKHKKRNFYDLCGLFIDADTGDTVRHFILDELILFNEKKFL